MIVAVWLGCVALLVVAYAIGYYRGRRAATRPTGQLRNIELTSLSDLGNGNVSVGYRCDVVLADTRDHWPPRAA